MARQHKRDKLEAFMAWLRDSFKTPYPVVLQFRKLGGKGDERIYGETYRNGRRLYITIDPRMSTNDSIGVMIHEHAHAVVWRHDTVERARVHHDAEWGLAYAKIYSAWHDTEEA